MYIKLKSERISLKKRILTLHSFQALPMQKLLKRWGYVLKSLSQLDLKQATGLIKNGGVPTIEADTHTLSGMLEALLDYLMGCDNFDKNKI